eukprot:NODE_2283_length_1241_cov_30.463926_g2079_i0.p1 GENE.NODE_2283_length_1241_cov_30.463926_g2079_i0~~NODE_2283_length_1241_cov_30.463926_g2079_i0.p1  ORF type:complete len:260 (-),score=56.19 NODE_2283_length_1241_cov_30.463926_g2079_i0:341-1120(-)
MARPLANCVALVTGAAQGLGRAAATRFAQSGARVVLVDMNADAGSAFAKELGSNVVFAPADVTSESDINAALDLAERNFGSNVNAAINCAGMLIASRVLGKKGPHSLETFMKSLQVNVGGTFNVCRLAAARMAAGPADSDGERGVLINTASIAAFDGQIGQCAYAATKGAIASLTLPMARDLSSSGIRVLTIAPGIFLTPMMMETVPTKARDALAELVPFPPRLGNPEEFATLAEFLITHKYMNGEVVRVDGSLRMPHK